jgi:uncharacterized protein involved in exopolysaccharide biosynthesis
MTDRPERHDDELSLRDLYLAIRRHVVGIVVVGIVAGALAGGATLLSPARYQAEATVAVVRIPVTVQQESGLSLRPELDITFDTYRTLASSRGVMERVVAAVPAAGLSPAAAQERFTVERLAGAATGASPLLAIAHRVGHVDPALAAQLATAWASTTVETVRALYSENLGALDRITSSEMERAVGTLRVAEEALSDVRASQDASADPRRLDSLQLRLGQVDERLDEVTRLAAAVRAQRDVLERRVAEGAEQVVLFDAPAVALSVQGAVWASDARLAALEAEREALLEQRAAIDTTIRTAAVSVARHESQVARLERSVEAAQRSVDRLADIEPTLEYVAQLAPTAARVLGEAFEPARPESRRTLVVAVLAAAVAGFVSVLFVLLREAVREPDPPAAGLRRPPLQHAP